MLPAVTLSDEELRPRGAHTLVREAEMGEQNLYTLNITEVVIRQRDV